MPFWSRSRLGMMAMTARQIIDGRSGVRVPSRLGRNRGFTINDRSAQIARDQEQAQRRPGLT
jgi:hypothetical protein